MSFMFAFLPITFAIFVLLLLFYFIKKTTVKPKQKFFKGKILYLFLSCYLLLLLVSTLIFSFIPFDKYKLVQPTENYEGQVNTIYDLYEGKIDPNLEVRNKFTFEYVEDTLDISVDTNEILGTTVIIEKKDTNDGVIETACYLNPIIIGKIDFTEKIPFMSAEITGNTLLLHEPQYTNIRISKIKKEFVLSQFTGETPIDDLGSNFSGERIFYMQIPKELEVTSSMDNIYIHYVGE